MTPSRVRWDSVKLTARAESLNSNSAEHVIQAFQRFLEGMSDRDLNKTYNVVVVGKGVVTVARRDVPDRMRKDPQFAEAFSMFLCTLPM